MIAFASTGEGEPQIFLYDLPSGEIRQLTNIRGGACQPSWSPDGQWLVFVVPCAANQQRYDGSSLFASQCRWAATICLYHPPRSAITIPNGRRWRIRSFSPRCGISTGRKSGCWTSKPVNRSIFQTTPSSTTSQPGRRRQQDHVLIQPGGQPRPVVGDGCHWRQCDRIDHSDVRTNIEPVWGPDNDLVLYSQFDGRGGGVPKADGQ